MTTFIARAEGSETAGSFVFSVFFFLETDGTRAGFTTASGCGAGCDAGIGVAGAAAATGGASALLNPPVTAITVDKPTPINTAVTNSIERCWTNDDVRAGAGGKASGSGRATTALTTGMASICNALSSQHPSSSETTRFNDGSIDRREL